MSEKIASLHALGQSYWAEVWGSKDIWITPDGLVASTKGKTARMINPIRCGGYKAVHLSAAKKQYVHALVLETFVAPRPTGMQARHLDGNRDNNHIRNLAWGTPTENNADKVRHGTETRGERNPMARLTSGAVAQMRSEHAVSGESYAALGKRFGVSPMTAWRAVKGESWR